MTHIHNASTRQALAEFNYRRGRYRQVYQWGQTNVPYLVQRQLLAAQAATEIEPDVDQILEGWIEVTGSSVSNRYRWVLKCIRRLSQAVNKRDPIIFSVLVWVIVSWYFGQFWLVLDLLALAGVLAFYKVVTGGHYL